MAISFVGSTLVEASSGASTQNTNTMVIPAAAGDNNIAVAFLFASSPTVNLAVPGSWTLIQGPVTSTGVGTAEQSGAWWFPVNASDAGASVSIVDDIGGSNKSVSGLTLFSGVDTTSPVALHSGVAQTSSTGSRTTPALTGATLGTAVVEAVSDRVGSNTGAWSVPAGFTDAGQSNPDGLMSVVLAYALGKSGDIGGDTYTKTVTAPQAHMWTVALKSAGGSTVRPNGMTSADFLNVGGAADRPTALADELDTTYVTSPDNPAGATGTIDFPTLAAGPITVKVRHRASAASPTVSRLYEVLQGGTSIASRTVTLPSSWTDYSFTLTAGELALVTDRSALHVRLTDTVNV